MKTKIPKPIWRRIIMLGWCMLLYSLIGIVASLILFDGRMLVLTFAVLTAGALTACELYYAAIEQRYEVVEGIVKRRYLHPLRTSQEVILQLEDNREVTLILAGHTKFKRGGYYRLFLQEYKPLFKDMNLSSMFQPSRTVMGYELLQVP